MQGRWKVSVPFAATIIIILLPFLNAENVRTNRQKSTHQGQRETPVLLNEHISILSQFANLIDPEAYDFEILDVNGAKVSLNQRGPKPAALPIRTLPATRRMNSTSASLAAPVRTATPKRKPAATPRPQSRLLPHDELDISNIMSSLQLPTNPVSAVPAGQSGYQTVLITPLEQLLPKAERRENAMVKTYVRQEKNLLVPVLPTERIESPNQVKMEGYMTKNDNSMAYYFNKVPDFTPRQVNSPQPDIFNEVPQFTPRPDNRPQPDIFNKVPEVTPRQVNSPQPDIFYKVPEFIPKPDNRPQPEIFDKVPEFTLRTDNRPKPEIFGKVPEYTPRQENRPQPDMSIHPKVEEIFEALRLHQLKQRTKPEVQSSIKSTEGLLSPVQDSSYNGNQNHFHVPAISTDVFEALRLHQLKQRTKPKVQSSMKSTEGVLSPLQELASNNGNENHFNVPENPPELQRLNDPSFVPTEPATAFVPVVSPHNLQWLQQSSEIPPVRAITENPMQTFSLPIMRSAPPSPPIMEASTFWEPAAIPVVRAPKQLPKPKVELHVAADVSLIKTPEPSPPPTSPAPSVSFKANFSFPSFNQARQRQRQRPRRPRLRTFDPPKLDYSDWKPITQRPSANEITEAVTKATKHEDPTNQNHSDLEGSVTSTFTSSAFTAGREENPKNPVTTSPAKQQQGTSEGSVVISPVPLHKQRKIKMLRKKKRRFPSKTRSQIQQDVQLKNNGVTEPVPVKYSVSSSMSIHIPKSNKLLKFGDSRIKKQIRAAIVVGSRQPRTIGQIARRRMHRQQLNARSWLRSMSHWPARQINAFMRGAGRSMRRNLGSGAKKMKTAFDHFRRRMGNF